MVTDQPQIDLWDEILEDDEALERAIAAYAEDKDARSHTRELKTKRDKAISDAGLLNRTVGTTIRIGQWQLKIGENEEKDISFTRGGNKAIREVQRIPE
ncbi:hypothetical protein LCGC14_1470270 [marine sediment metagenome]|uniref:Uncharacterized protein n=1 Tax=marine sediment metagenome TaxID=412755 RepID=A0A0F9MEB8_9ZZZZ